MSEKKSGISQVSALKSNPDKSDWFVSVKKKL